MLVVWKLDRLGRNLGQHECRTCRPAAWVCGVLAGQGAQVDTTTAASRLVFGIFAALAGRSWAPEPDDRDAGGLSVGFRPLPQTTRVRPPPRVRRAGSSVPPGSAQAPVPAPCRSPLHRGY